MPTKVPYGPKKKATHNPVPTTCRKPHTLCRCSRNPKSGCAKIFEHDGQHFCGACGGKF